MSDFLLVEIQLPDDEESRKEIISSLQVGGTYRGGLVTGMSLEDETRLKISAINLDPHSF